MSRKWIIVIIILAFIFFSAYGLFFIWLIGRSARGLPGTGSVAIVRIEGVISSSGGGGGIFSIAGTSPETVITQLRRADRDFSVKSILLRIDSPGGTASASQEIYREIKRVKKPVVASIGDIGASGAYYAASAADVIVANPASAVGSIGVILEVPNMEELLKKLGVEYTFITRGKYKDIGNPTRPLTPEEREILESQAEEIYGQFIADVAKGREMPVGTVKELATGLTYLGSDALGLKLVDKIGNFQDAVDLAAKLGKIKGEPGIVEYGAPSLLDVIQNLFKSININQLSRGYLYSFPLQPQTSK